MSCLIALAALLSAPSAGYGHAMLLRSDPVSGSRMAVAPAQVRLVFSEELERGLARLSLVDAAGVATALSATLDPHDVHAVVAPLAKRGPGKYRVRWRVVSADGHPIEGTISFEVIGDTAGRALGQVSRDSIVGPMEMPGFAEVVIQGSVTWGPALFGAPVLASVLRGLALLSLMMLTGVLCFASMRSGDLTRVATPALRALMWLTVATPVLLILHHLVWMMDVIPMHEMSLPTMTMAMSTGVAHVESWRAGLSLLALWALVLARRPRLALLFAMGALLVSGSTGHSAAIESAWTMPAKAVHLLAGAIWIGGVLWLLLGGRSDLARVSRAAMLSLLAVLFSGVVQTRFFISSPRDLVATSYGVLVLAKILGLIVLGAFGAHHRTRGMPALHGDASAQGRFDAVLRREIVVMVIVALLGGLLAYVPAPANPTSSMQEMP